MFPILAIDVGTKRVGLALMHELSGKADFKTIVSREANKALQTILKLIKTKAVSTVVAGFPLGAEKQRTPQCLDVERFCHRIERRAAIKIKFVDEYLSSCEAELEQTRKTKRVDAEAAEIILKRYLVEIEARKTVLL